LASELEKALKELLEALEQLEASITIVKHKLRKAIEASQQNL